jgi:hypothetical protein
VSTAAITFHYAPWLLKKGEVNAEIITIGFETPETTVDGITKQMLDMKFGHVAGGHGIWALQLADYCRIDLPNGERWIIKDRTGPATPYQEGY